MIDLTISLELIEEYAKKLADMPDGLVEDITSNVAEHMRNEAIGRTPVDTSELKNSWSPVQQYAGGFSFGTDKSYARILEEGRYRGIGPRTHKIGQGIYSSQTPAPGGMISPLLSDRDQLNKTIREALDYLTEHIPRK